MCAPALHMSAPQRLTDNRPEPRFFFFPIPGDQKKFGGSEVGFIYLFIISHDLTEFPEQKKNGGEAEERWRTK